MRHYYRWWILGVSTLTQLVAGLASQGIGAWGLYAQDALHLSARQVGGLATLANIVPIFGLALVGRALDRHGERLPVFLGMLVLGFSMLLLAVSTGYGTLAAAMLMMGIGYSPIQPGGSKAIYHWFPTHERGMAMGVRQAALPLGGACAAVFFPELILRAGWASAMTVAAVVIAVTGGIYLAVFRNASRPDAGSPSAISMWQHLLGNFSEAAFRRISLIGAMLVAVQTAVAVFWIMFVQRRFDLMPAAAAWSLFVVQMSGSLGRILLSALSDHIRGGRRRVVIICMVLAPAALLATALLPASCRGLPILACAAFSGFFCFGWYGPWVVWLSESTDHNKVGEVIGAAMAVNQVAIAAVPLIFGMVADMTGTPTVPLMCLSAGLFAVFVWDRLCPVGRSGLSPSTSN
ncbi:major facilitator superfamily protein [Burkholderia lata]|uniref:MFS transporter n=1 Tax=Burkholderia lata (strain ATCC 17760 / DSM 23089 / LMG 22485 / NCIMB 9086 / R18194 / 383) TaxID=482957 RepID=UPI001452DD0C|nr:MFS transporter [Burkholderia lata]VWD12278.1 major facilitator superfamily protein [Burkholderia lata]